jgi:rare lipoprotein A
MSRLVRSAGVLMLMALVGCSSGGGHSDGRPLYELKPHEVPEPVPQAESILAAGNTSPYRVNGKTYRVMDSAEGYREEGTASWYGRKFHGRRTANGELFNAYAATAAHRSLPIPCYVRVTNLENHSSMIVRVNDRGPFHADRIIDLSYAAAVRLGFEKQGTAPIRVELLEVEGGEDLRMAAPGAGHYRYIQVGSFSKQASADALSTQLRSQMQAPVAVSEILLGDSPYYRVRVGPVEVHQELLALHRQLQELGYLEVRLMPD